MNCMEILASALAILDSLLRTKVTILGQHVILTVHLENFIFHLLFFFSFLVRAFNKSKLFILSVPAQGN